jgi:hypothetical protein
LALDPGRHSKPEPFCTFPLSFTSKALLPENLTHWQPRLSNHRAHKLLKVSIGDANAYSVLNRCIMKMATRSLALLALLGAPLSAFACEPIVPFLKAIGGPRVLTASFVVLGLVVLLKSAAFARFQTRLSFTRALLWMLAANVFTSIIGVMVPAMIDSGGAILVGLPLVWALCLLPGQRLIAAAPLTRLARFTPGQLACGMTVLLAFSCLLFIISRTIHDSDTFLRYWLVKGLAVHLALIIGLAITAFWEEWIVWRLSRSEDDDLTFVRPVLRANLIVLLAVMVVSAAIMIPKRLKQPDFIPPQQSKLRVQTPKL